MDSPPKSSSVAVSERILLTGGLGYIGSHTAVELLNEGYEIVILDNLYNSKMKCLDRLKQITGKDNIPFENVDLKNIEQVDKVFSDYKPTTVIHFAAMKSVGESVSKPLEYYDNNLAGTINLLRVMQKYKYRHKRSRTAESTQWCPRQPPTCYGRPNPTTLLQKNMMFTLLALNTGEVPWTVNPFHYGGNWVQSVLSKFIYVNLSEASAMIESRILSLRCKFYRSQVYPSKHNCNKFIFSSSACVYGDGNPKAVETDTGTPTNPYGQTKSMIEQIMRDVAHANPSFTAIALRYFNPVGAHPSGLIGEDPKDIPNNLMPYIQKVAAGVLKQLTVFGSDYGTQPDGTGVRDYIHVVDLAKGHTAAMKKKDLMPGFHVYNLGTGNGTSVLQLVEAFEKASGMKVPYVMGPRRPGDVATLLAIPDKANRELGWKTELGIEEMCRDAYNWTKNNPNGYE